MERRILGATGISVSEFALGAMMFGSMGGTDTDGSVRMISAALDAGINFVDTADVYSSGESEVIVGKAIKGRRDSVVLATKFAMPMGEDANQRGGSPRWIRTAVEDSLLRLDTDHIDLYQMHRPDHSTPIEETLGALSDLVRAGKVRAIGASTTPVERIVEAQWAAERGGHVRFQTEQLLYSIFNRTIESAVLPTAQRYNMGVLTYSPLGGGWLSGRGDPSKARRAAGRPTLYDPSNPDNQKKSDALEKLTALAAKSGLPLTHLATAFVRAHPAITAVIMGPRTPEQLADLLASAEVKLSGDILDRIDEIVAPGTELNSSDNYLATPPALADSSLRRG